MTTTARPTDTATDTARTWLAGLVGEWTYEAEAAAPGEPPATQRGTERVRSLGQAWAIGESLGDDGSDPMILTLGYDPARGRWVGTFVAAAMPHLWIYDGTLDADGRVLTLETEGPSLTTEGATGRYRDTIERLDDDRRVMTSRYLGDDGEWHVFMTMRSTRTGPASA